MNNTVVTVIAVEMSTTKLQSGVVSLRFTPAAPILSSSEEDSEEEEDEQQEDEQMSTENQSKIGETDESSSNQKSNTSRGEDDDDDVKNKDDYKLVSGKGKIHKNGTEHATKLPVVSDLLNNINYKNASFRSRAKKSNRPFQVQPIKLDPNTKRRKRKVRLFIMVSFLALLVQV